jgi:hypothetical protein
MKRLRAAHAPSSDTEDDSQGQCVLGRWIACAQSLFCFIAIDLFPAATPVFKVPAPPTTALKSLGPPRSKPSVAMDSSQTEDESQNPSQSHHICALYVDLIIDAFYQCSLSLV